MVEDSAPAVDAGSAKLEVAWMKEDVDALDAEEEAEDVADGEADWTTSFFEVLVMEEIVEEVDEVDVGVDVVVGVELVVLEVSVSLPFTWADAGVGVGVGVGVGLVVLVVVGDAAASLLLLLFLFLSLDSVSGVAAAVMYPPMGPSKVLAAVW